MNVSVPVSYLLTLVAYIFSNYFLFFSSPEPKAHKVSL